MKKYKNTLFYIGVTSGALAVMYWIILPIIYFALSGLISTGYLTQGVALC